MCELRELAVCFVLSVTVHHGTVHYCPFSGLSLEAVPLGNVKGDPRRSLQLIRRKLQFCAQECRKMA